MKDILTYKGFVGTVHFSQEDMVFHGKIEGINDLISYEGSSVKALVKDFRAAVDDYLATCEEMGREPQKPFKGSFNVRISPELHRRAAMKAKLMGLSLNQLVQKAVEEVALREDAA